MNLRMTILAVIVALAVAIPGYCSVPLTFYSSARPMGMGGAFTAVADYSAKYAKILDFMGLIPIGQMAETTPPEGEP